MSGVPTESFRSLRPEFVAARREQTARVRRVFTAALEAVRVKFGPGRVTRRMIAAWRPAVAAIVAFVGSESPLSAALRAARVASLQERARGFLAFIDCHTTRENDFAADEAGEDLSRVLDEIAGLEPANNFTREVQP